MFEHKLSPTVRAALEHAPDREQLLRLVEALVAAYSMDDEHETQRDAIRQQLLASHQRLYPTEQFGLLETPLGWAGLSWTRKGLRQLILPRQSREEVLGRLGSPAELSQPPEELVAPLERYFAGEPIHPELPLDIEALPAFRRQVLELVHRIPYGETRSYRWIAEKLGVRSYRAVGQAVGANPVPIVIPCHRVVASNGSLQGYAGGLELKRRLLELEGARLGAAH